MLLKYRNTVSLSSTIVGDTQHEMDWIVGETQHEMDWNAIARIVSSNLDDYVGSIARVISVAFNYVITEICNLYWVH